MRQNCDVYLRDLAFLLEHRKVFGDEVRVPEAAVGFFAHGLGCLFMGKRRFVRTSGAERVVNVDDLQDPWEHWNFHGGQSIGVAGSVRMLVMMTDDRKDEPQGMERLADILPRNGMELHDFPLGGREIATLLENFIRDCNLAEIVEVSAALQGDERIFVHAEMAAEFDGVYGEPLAVALGVGITAFDNQSKSAENGVGGFELVGEFLQAQERLDAGDELRRGQVCSGNRRRRLRCHGLCRCCR